MKRVVFDIESDNLLDKITVIHCLVLRDLDTGQIVSCTDSFPGYTSISEGLSLLSEAERIYGHNSIKFDLPAIKKIYPAFSYKGRSMDTLVVARMRWAHIEPLDYEKAEKGAFPKNMCGKHSLEAWGHRLDLHKGDYKKWCSDNGIDEPFKVWRPEMQEYCVQDTAVTAALVKIIREQGVSDESVETEQELAEYLAQQETNGWPFDKASAIELVAKLSARREEVAQSLIAEFGSWLARDGKPFTPKKDNKKKGVHAGCPYSKLKLVEFNPASRDHIANRLIRLYGWKPEKFTDSGKPQVDEGSLEGMKFAAAEKLIEYLMLDKRLGQISEGKEAWLKHMTDTGAGGGKLTGMFHIHGQVNQSKAITHRAGHSKPNIAQTPKVGNPFGAECRALFTVPEGWVQLGADASGLELRCLAHYMARYDDGAYGKLILEGDVHSANRDALGLSGKEGRDMAKTWIYAFLYGAGDEKLGSILEPGASSKRKKSLGKKLKKDFMQNTPAMRYLVEAVQATASKKGYLITLDGRRVYIRHQHAALNSLLQCAGAIVCKRWIVEYNRRLCKEFDTPFGGGWKYPWAALGWIHDETQLAVKPEIKETASGIVVASIEHMTGHFNFRVPLTGEAKFGSNWRDTH